jgi:hypothetical protein
VAILDRYTSSNTILVSWLENNIELRKIVDIDTIVFDNWLLVYSFIATSHVKIRPSSLFLLFIIVICLNGMFTNYYYMKSVYGNCLKNYIFFRPVSTDCPSYSLFKVNSGLLKSFDLIFFYY